MKGKVEKGQGEVQKHRVKGIYGGKFQILSFISSLTFWALVSM